MSVFTVMSHVFMNSRKFRNFPLTFMTRISRSGTRQRSNTPHAFIPRSNSMSAYQKYYDLSSDESDGDSSSSSSEEEIGHDDGEDNDGDDRDDDGSLWGRSVLHIDVDCFYVQCEEIDQRLRESSEGEMERPLAIGQKHIVVTCNYVARSRGVTKLMSKTDAMRICPDLRIVDGSDLRRYRTHSRKIYEAFRVAVQEEVGSILNFLNYDTEIGIQTQSITPNERTKSTKMADSLPCKRNAMDEMMADISTVVNKLYHLQSEKGERTMLHLLSHLSQRNNDRSSQTSQNQVSKTYVFGDDSESSTVRIVEDQSGESSNIVFGGDKTRNESHSDTDRIGRSLAPTRRNVHEDNNRNNQNGICSLSKKRFSCRNRLGIAVRLARLVCDSVYYRTKFHVSAGISVSPMLAKLSVIQKPKTVNLLLPWRSPELLYLMPLRKIHEIGSRTYRALSQSVVPFIPEKSKAPNVRVCDFLRVPREKIVEALLPMLIHENEGRRDVNATDRAFCEQKCSLILERCRGLDYTVVEDDGGGLPQTVSVENSFRRGTMTTETAVQAALSELCRRLPPLIEDRVAWSRDPSLAFPTTIRLTVRSVRKVPIQRNGRSSRHITRSKQTSIGMHRGKIFLPSTGNNLTGRKDEMRAVKTLYDFTIPLLKEMISRNEEKHLFGNERSDISSSINITRMNIAVTNFQDTVAKDRPCRSPFLNSQRSKAINNTASSQSSSKDTSDFGSQSQSQWELDVNSNNYFENFQQKKRKDSFAVNRSSETSIKRTKSSSAGSVKYRSETPRKFSRTRIDHFFAKK